MFLFEKEIIEVGDGSNLFNGLQPIYFNKLIL